MSVHTKNIFFTLTISFFIGYVFSDGDLVFNDDFTMEYVNEYIKNITEVPANPYSYQSQERNCTGSSPQIYYQRFYMEHYTVMGPACDKCANGVTEDCFNPQCVTADGVERGCLTVNRQIPGPKIVVCLGDRIVIDVINGMLGVATAIHWHGMLQHGTQYMDGVPYLTQCPIHSGMTFRYMMSSNDVGTQFWHAHFANQKQDGLFGAIIVKQPELDDPNHDMYDDDNIVCVISDWQHNTGAYTNPGLPTIQPNLRTEAVLIDGKGRWNDTTTGIKTNTTYRVIFLKSGIRSRCRIIFAASHVCSLKVKLENHTFTVIALDGTPCEPKVVTTIVGQPGQRIDVVINEPNNRTKDTYWMIVEAIGICIPSKVYQLAMVTYDQPEGTQYITEPDDIPSYGQYSDEVILSGPDYQSNDPNHLKITSIKSYDTFESREPDVKLCLEFAIVPLDYNEAFFDTIRPSFLNVARSLMVVGTIDKISSVIPSSPYISQPWNIDRSRICNSTHKPSDCANKTLCYCYHVIKVPLNALLEITFIDTDPISPVNHPIHMHGHSMRVKEVGQLYNGTKLTKSVCENWNRTEDFLGTSSAIQDTPSLPSGGYATMHVLMNNPGIWFIHCHIDDHMHKGMNVVMQVGEQEDLPDVPWGFPKCGDFNNDGCSKKRHRRRYHTNSQETYTSSSDYYEDMSTNTSYYSDSYELM